MKCGVSLKTRAISAGSGMLLIMKRVMCWRMSLATEKMSFSSSLKGFWNLSAFNIITRMIGGLMNSSYLNSNIQSAKATLRRSKENSRLYALASSGWQEKQFAFPNWKNCMTSRLACSSIALNLGWLCSINPFEALPEPVYDLSRAPVRQGRTERRKRSIYEICEHSEYRPTLYHGCAVRS